ncbi:hypothetical protein CVT26_001391 [Gymnopilus dilepis]|uniref:Ubiquitin-like domain-containing protein n=1 Tax=Gymnopilus dilepis TaxID=231916 RepID=A0A409WK76_9AGAR|nr:hypothetical protein CVT26_001391 [Gymnopilus dilepis]
MAEENHPPPPPFGSHETFLYEFENRRIIARRERDYAKAISKCREMFPGISQTDPIIFYTHELFCCHGQPAEISEEIWDEALSTIQSVRISVHRHLSEVDLITPEIFSHAGDRVLIRPEFFMDGSKCDMHVYMTPATKLQKLAKFMASTMKIDEGGLLLAHRGQVLDLNKSILANGLPSGSLVQCVHLQGASGVGNVDSEGTSPPQSTQ